MAHFNEIDQSIKDKIVEMYRNGLRFSEIEAAGVACFHTIKKTLRESGAKLEKRQAYNFDDKTGKRFGILTVLAQAGHEHSVERATKRKKKRILWLCQCDCGNQLTVSSLRLATGNTRSCGCVHSATTAELNRQLKRLANSEASAKNSHWLRYQHSAKQRKFEWVLTREEFYRLTTASCDYCGRAPFRYVYAGKYSKCLCNGVDRKDSKIGYTAQNCVTACTDCNTGKMEMSAEAYVAHCQRVADHQKTLSNKQLPTQTDPASL